MKEKSYTLEQIKSSFFKTFNESGEWFFPYFGDEEGGKEANAKTTERIFAEFKEELDSCDGESKESGNISHLIPKDGSKYSAKTEEGRVLIDEKSLVGIKFS